VSDIRSKRRKAPRASRTRKSPFFTAKDWMHLGITVALRILVALWP
jgi:hypothetical protein